MIAHLFAACVLILMTATCIFQAIASLGMGDRRAALCWSGDAGLLGSFGALLAWGGAWS